MNGFSVQDFGTTLFVVRAILIFMRKILFYVLSLIVLGIVAAFIYQFAVNFTYTRHITLPPQLLASSSTDAGNDVSATPDVFGLTDMSVLDLATSTIDTSLWSTYTDKELGFTINYPKNLVINTGTPGTLIVAVPKDAYFHWPLLDDVKMTITASSSCPAILASALDVKPVTLKANGYTFVRSEGSDVAAGNIYRELAYDTTKGSFCYHIDLLDHGSNGAGLYVSDQSLISRYDAQHQVDLMTVLGVFAQIVNSFKIVL